MNKPTKKILEKPNWIRLKQLYRLSYEIMCLIDTNLTLLNIEDMIIILDNLKNTLTERKGK